jgi:hypothetical protein
VTICNGDDLRPAGSKTTTTICNSERTLWRWEKVAARRLQDDDGDDLTVVLRAAATISCVGMCLWVCDLWLWGCV